MKLPRRRLLHLSRMTITIGFAIVGCIDNEAVGRPFDSTVNGARMIGSGVFDKATGADRPHGRRTRVSPWSPRVHLAPQLQGDPRPAGRQALQERAAAIRLLQDQHLGRLHGVQPVSDPRAAVEMCGADRVVFGSDYGPIPYGIKEHVQIVEDVLPSPAERQQVFWKTSNRVFRLGQVDTDLVTPASHQSR